jgi:TRAP-type C4-dicarboxylate transport system permease small subunit
MAPARVLAYATVRMLRPGQRVPTFLLELACAVLMLLLIGLVSAQVVMRYAFNAPLVWSEELARMVFVYLTFVGAALAFHRRENLRLPILTDALPRRGRRWLQATMLALEIAFLAVVIAYSVPLLQRLAPARTPALEWSMATVYAGVLVGAVAILVAAAADLVRTVGELRGRAPDA